MASFVPSSLTAEGVGEGEQRGGSCFVDYRPFGASVPVLLPFLTAESVVVSLARGPHRKAERDGSKEQARLTWLSG